MNCGLFEKIKSLFTYLFSLLPSISEIRSNIYDLIFSKSLTVASYKVLYEQFLADRLQSFKSILDIGIATGNPIRSINHHLKDKEITGIDIDEHYIDKARANLKQEPNIEVMHLNFYDIETLKRKFDVLLFGSSFMLMPDQKKALEVSKRVLNKNGKVYFLLTLYKSSNNHSFIKRIKPILKKYTSVDFGRLIYEDEMEQIITSNGLRIVKKERVYQGVNPLFYIFRFFCIECEFVN